jgi:hypothetical protein
LKANENPAQYATLISFHFSKTSLHEEWGKAILIDERCATFLFHHFLNYGHLAPGPHEEDTGGDEL